MKRQLDKKEAGLTEKGIAKQQKLIDECKDQLEYLVKTKKFINAKREYEDYTQPKKRQSEDLEIESEVKHLTSQINNAEASIKTMEGHLNEGVEVKDKSNSYTG